VKELLTLSTQAFTYFQSKGGFSEGTPDDLPPARREKYDAGGRNSKVLVKKLSAEAAPGAPPTKPVLATVETKG
jgi:amino-acid N-acetyltransferase